MKLVSFVISQFSIDRSVEVKSSGPEFEKKYKELVKVRQNYKKSCDVYEKKLQQYNEVVAHHEKIRNEMYHMKVKLQEVSVAPWVFLFSNMTDLSQ